MKRSVARCERGVSKDGHGNHGVAQVTGLAVLFELS
jgi:hypothetical protein